MQFADPKSDIAFKKLFGDMKHKNVLINFLNSVLERPASETIVEVDINDPHNNKENEEDKFSIVDVRCTDKKGNRFIVEMQVERENDYLERAQYYTALALGRQLKKAMLFGTLEPVIFIGVLNFKLDDDPRCVTHHFLMEATTHKRLLRHSEFHFVEIKKFEKDLDQLENDLDKWLYTFKHAFSLDNVPPALKATPVIEEAFGILEQGKWSDQERDQYEHWKHSAMARNSQLVTAREEGIEEGIEKGKMEEKYAIARQLLDILAAATVAKKTGLGLEEVEALKKKIL